MKWLLLILFASLSLSAMQETKSKSYLDKLHVPLWRQVMKMAKRPELLFWNTKHPKTLKPDFDMEAHSAAVSALIYDNENEYLISGSVNGQIRMWDLEHNLSFMKLKNHAIPSAFCLNKAKNQIIVGGKDGSIKLWDVQKKEFIFLPGHEKQPIIYLKINKTGDRLISQSADGIIKVWNLDTHINMIGLHHHKAFALDLDRNYLIVGTTDRQENKNGEIEIYNLESSKIIKIYFNLHKSSITNIFLDRENEHFICSSADGMSAICSLDTGAILTKLAEPIIFMESKKGFYITQKDTALRCWKIPGNLLFEINTALEKDNAKSGNLPIKTIKIDVENQRLLTLTDKAKIWDLATGKLVHTIDATRIVSFNYPYLVCIVNNNLRLWDFTCGQCAQITVPNKSIILFNNAKKRLMVGLPTGIIRIYDFVDNKMIHFLDHELDMQNYELFKAAFEHYKANETLLLYNDDLLKKQFKRLPDNIKDILRLTVGIVE